MQDRADLARREGRAEEAARIEQSITQHREDLAGRR